MTRDPSIDMVQINSISVEPILPTATPAMPPSLTKLQKCLAFFGDNKLLAMHAHRQALKRGYRYL